MPSISFTAHGRCARATVCEPITTGSVGLSVSFAFDAAWSGLQKTAIFRGSGMAVDLVLSGDAATVPPEVLTIPGGDLRVGVWGADPDGNVIIPTVWATVGEIVPGAAPSGFDPDPPTPSWAAQVQEISLNALNTANSVREDADAGEFDGATYTPAVSAGGDLSWTNDKGKPNPPTVNIKGTEGQPGQTGATPDISIGTVETLPPGSPATATITGTAENPVLSFGIPQGQQGAPGEVTQAEFDDLADEVSQQKSALKNGAYVTDKYVSGARNSSGNISANATRCTTKDVFPLVAGDTMSVKNLDAELRAVIAGVSGNSFVYDSGWKTDEFSYTVTEETQGIYFVNFSKLGNENILPTDIITSQVAVKNYQYLNKIDKIPLLENAVNDQPSETVLAKTISAGFIKSDGTVDTTVSGYGICTLQDAELIESIVVSNLSASYKYYCFYDSSDTPIGNRKSLAIDTEITIPDGVSIIRICSATAAVNGAVITASKYTNIHRLFSDIDNLTSIVHTEITIHPDSLITDGFINISGEQMDSSGFVCTGYLELPFEEASDFTITGTFNAGAGCAIYNGNKQCILGITGDNVASYGGVSSDTIQNLSLPYQDGMRYIRISGQASKVSGDPNKLGVTGNTLAGTFERIFDVEQELRAVASQSSSAIPTSKVLVIGDSISTDAYGSYTKWVTDLIQEGFLPSDTTNSSQHATGFVARYNNEANDFVSRLKAIQNPSQYDLVVVFGGINDYIQNIPMGSESGTDYTVSFKPAVNEFFNYLIQNFTQARLCVLLPLRTYATWQNSVGEYQQAYGDYIKQVAKSYCLPVLNLTEDSGFFPFISTFSEMWTFVPQGYQSGDGVHPNEEYERRFLAPMIKHFLQGLM